VSRGGAWRFGYAYGARCADRNNSNPTNSYDDVGFRCVRANPYPY
jgi:formylglycine-generating enzyme required for sulfatase activity